MKYYRLQIISYVNNNNKNKKKLIVIATLPSLTNSLPPRYNSPVWHMASNVSNQRSNGITKNS